MNKKKEKKERESHKKKKKKKNTDSTFSLVCVSESCHVGHYRQVQSVARSPHDTASWLILDKIAMRHFHFKLQYFYVFFLLKYKKNIVALQIILIMRKNKYPVAIYCNTL